MEMKIQEPKAILSMEDGYSFFGEDIHVEMVKIKDCKGLYRNDDERVFDSLKYRNVHKGA